MLVMLGANVNAGLPTQAALTFTNQELGNGCEKLAGANSLDKLVLFGALLAAQSWELSPFISLALACRETSQVDPAAWLQMHRKETTNGSAQLAASYRGTFRTTLGDDFFTSGPRCDRKRSRK